jgi:hypothetical protein
MSCSNNLKQIALALHNYHDRYGSLPPAYVADEDGKPMHSWRVLILPYLEQQALYDIYDMDEPWNGPNNIQLLKDVPSIYACPSATGHSKRRGTCTSYVAVVGPTTPWPAPSVASFATIKDGMSNTALVVESNHEIPWLEPRDLQMDEAMALLTSGNPESSGCHRSEDFFYEYFSGRNVAIGDGRIRFLGHGIERRVWSALLGAADGIELNDSDLEGRPILNRRLRVGNCERLALFLVLVVFPLPWVWLPRKMRTTRGGDKI